MEKSIADLRLPDDTSLLAQMPPPGQSLAKVTPKVLFETARACCKLWRDLAAGVLEVPDDSVEATCPHCGGERRAISGSDVADRVVVTLATYYDFAAKTLCDKKLPKGEPLIPGLNVIEMREFIGNIAGEQNAHRALMKLFTAHYFTAWQASYFLKLLEPTDLPHPLLGQFEAVAHTAVRDMFRLAVRFHGYLATFANYLIASSLEFLVSVYEGRQSSWNKAHKVGAFSRIKTSDLGLLAKRDKSMLDRYGGKRVEKVFEYQLNLALQSLGFYVVQTRTGERTVDLVCISGDASSPYSFLLEAKTTSSKYSLPTRDARAIVEYIEDVRRTLATLPKLSFLLLVGPTPARTLETKIRRLELEATLPVRFWTAQELANLRESIPGPVPAQRFAQAIVGAPHVIPSGFSERITNEYLNQQKAYQTFVRSMLFPVPADATGCAAHSPEPTDPPDKH